MFAVNAALQSIDGRDRKLALAEVIVVHAAHESFRPGADVRGVSAARLDADLGL